MNDIQGVLFDADGTLIDTYDIILTSMRYAVNDVLGCALDDAELMAGVGTPLYDQMLHFTGGDEARATSNSSSATTIGPSTSRRLAPSCEAVSFWAQRRNAVSMWATAPSTSRLVTLLAALPLPPSGACSRARPWRPSVPHSCAIR